MLVAAFEQWVNTFTGISRPCRHISDLSDGIILFEVAADIDAKWFKLIRSADMGDNWVTKYNNLQKLYKLVTRYLVERLGQSLANLEPPNLNAIAKDGDTLETLKLCALLIAVAVQCERNAVYIQHIQALPQQTQVALMFSLEQTIDALNNGGQMRDSDGEDNSADQELAQLQLQSERDEFERSHQALANEFTILKRKYEESQMEREDLQQRLREMERASAHASQSGKSDFLMRTEIEHLRQDLQKSEDRRHEQEILLNNQIKAIADLSRSEADLQIKADEAMRLKDKLDEYKHAIEKLQKTENVIEKYKKKLEEGADLRRQIKAAEEQNQELIERNKEVEEEYRKVLAFKSLMESYKKQIMTLESKSNQLLLERNQMEHEAKQQAQRLHQIEADHTRDLGQIQILEEKIRELELSGGGGSGGRGDGGSTSLAYDMMDIEDDNSNNNSLAGSLNNATELRLTISRLEREIQVLKEEKETSSVEAQTMVLQDLLENANRLKAKYESDYVAEHQAKLTLQAELDRLRLQQVTASTSVSSQDADAATLALLASIQATLQEREHELMEAQARLVAAKELEAANEELKRRLAAVMEEKEGSSGEAVAGAGGAPTAREAQLEAQLKQMTEQMNQVTVKFQQAKEFIVRQDAMLKESNNNNRADLGADSYPEAVGSLQSELAMKQEENKRLKIQMEEKRIQWRREQQLMVSAWHDQLKKGLRENVLAQHQRMAPTSWLGVQRKAFSSQLGVRP
ncbi:hypothetical protein DFQ27_002507 [Actinomortierella ambigua]|uniref:Calponin-homology (CH) domain-containing protein n=1 Tax=Actinomortierella ambigua TaxID=1343610 RepID=A0A9P6Q8C3_9FUNG|nr:hypothetical protein DFQ27_002507 [Actinomortierella ambigua]